MIVPPGSVCEVSPAGLAVVDGIARRIVTDSGAALIIDYGSSQSLAGESLQAVRQHQPVDPLAEPGVADLSAHVDFAGLIGAAQAAGAATHGPLPQGEFLHRLGLDARAASLRARATPAQVREIDAARRRLLDAREMGTLFKAVALAAPSLPTPPGFAELT